MDIRSRPSTFARASSLPSLLARVARLSIVASLLLVAAPVDALRPTAALTASDDEERELLETLASRDEEIRDAALEAARYPDTLVEMQVIQARSSASFEGLIALLDRNEQEAIWDLVREPGLLEVLVEGGAKTRKELDAIALDRPEAVRDSIHRFGEQRYLLLQDIRDLQREAEDAFDRALDDLPRSTQKAFDVLLGDPELASLLGRNVRLSLDLADAAQADPERLEARLVSVAHEAREAQEKAEAEWRADLEKDPELANELEDVAAEYADAHDYSYDELTGSSVQTQVTVHVHAYPYWFGYPSWYVGWVPWGVWYPLRPHLGFAYGPYHNRFYWGLPSLHFVHWFYGHPYHRYGHFSSRYNHHRYRHHRARPFRRAGVVVAGRQHRLHRVGQDRGRGQRFRNAVVGDRGGRQIARSGDGGNRAPREIRNTREGDRVRVRSRGSERSGVGRSTRAGGPRAGNSRAGRSRRESRQAFRAEARRFQSLPRAEQRSIQRTRQQRFFDQVKRQTPGRPESSVGRSGGQRRGGSAMNSRSGRRGGVSKGMQGGRSRGGGARAGGPRGGGGRGGGR